MNHLAEFALLLATQLLMAAPLVPTLSEWLQPTDDLPLAVDQNATHRLRHFADSLRHLMDGILGKAPSAVDLHALGGSVVRGNTRISIFQGPDGNAAVAANSVLESIGKQGRIAVFANPGQIGAHCNTLADIYGLADITIGSHVSLRSCCAKGDIRLASDVVVHRWMDAQNVIADANLTVQGRVTALESIRFSNGNRFLRAGAPAMYFGAQSALSEVARQPLAASVSTQRFLFDDDLQISVATDRHGHFVIRGSAEVAAQTDVGGSIKAHGKLRLHEKVNVAGGLVAGKHIDIGAGCHVLGPLICEDDIVIGPGCTIGTPDVATTVICRSLQVAQGVTIHGVITTHDGAQVVFRETKNAT